jgi:ubiquinone/menaquinone biosynthesis C-methylase UbiE
MKNKQIWSNSRVKKYQWRCQIPADDIYYGPASPSEKELHLIDEIKNKNIIEMGCGGAQNSIFLSKQGANVTAIDLSPSQIKYAKSLAEQNNTKINFYVEDMQNLKNIPSNSQDIALSVFAVQYINDLTPFLKEANRVLKKNGTLIFSYDHPYFTIVKKGKFISGSDPYFDLIKNNKLTINHSFTEKQIAEDFFDGKKITIYRHNTSETVSKLLENNFSIENIIEPTYNENYIDPWANFPIYRKEVVEKIPATIIYKARKIK